MPCSSLWTVRCAFIAGFVLVMGCTGDPAPGPLNLSTRDAASDSSSGQVAATEVPSAARPPDDSRLDVSIATAEPSGESASAESDAPAEQIVELLESAKYKLQTDDRDGAESDYRRAGQLAGRLLATRSPLTRQERRIGAIASYFHAKVLARGPEPQQAFAALQQAVEMGFEDLDRLDADAELSNLRELSAFVEFREALGARLALQTEQQIQQRLSELEPYALRFRLPDLDGTEVALEDFQGQVVVLAFWGTWCVKCQAEIPILNRLQETHGNRGVQVVGLCYEDADDVPAAVQRLRDFQETNPVRYLCLLGDEATRDQVRPPDDAPAEWVFPATLVLDQRGRVRLHFAGEVSYGKLEAGVLSLLGDR